MLASLYLILASIAGFGVVSRLLPTAPTIVRVPAGFLTGVVVTSWTTYLVADAFADHIGDPLRLGLVVSTVLSALVIVVWGPRFWALRLQDLRTPALDVVLALLSFVFSYWLLGNRLAYGADSGHPLMVSANTWGDFGLHIALSRSFSVGGNYPTEYPFFANEPIRYHFGYDFFAGSLQHGGLSVLQSFNLPGELGFTSMMLLLFSLGRLLFGRQPAAGQRWWRDRGVWVGLIAVLLLMTNQSLEWIRYVANDAHGSYWNAFRSSIWSKHASYASGGPYTNDRIAIFNTLNVYMTQTHLIVAMAFVFFVAFALIDQLRRGSLRPGLLLFLGVTFGMSFWLNGVLWIAAAVFFGSLLAIYAICAGWRQRQNAPAGRGGLAVREEAFRWLKAGGCFLVPSLLLGVPQAIYLNGGSADGGSLTLHIGYLVCSSTKASCHARGEMNLLSLADWNSFVQYWWLNEGLMIPLLVLAFVLGNRRDKKIITAVSAVFIWGSLFQLGQDLGGQNHKVINLWENLSGLFVAFALVEIWTVTARLVRTTAARSRAVSGLARAAVVFMLLFLTVSGVVDFLTIHHDFKVSVFGDATEEQAITWIDDNTPQKAVFLVDWDQLYTAPTMAGRGIFLGYSSWASSAGYPVQGREQTIKEIYSAGDRTTACALLTRNHLDYLVIGPQERSTHNFTLNPALGSQLTRTANVGGTNGYDFYRVAQSCPA